jgi:hypothetical protein
VLCSLVCLCLWFSAVAGDCYDDPQGNNKSYDNCDTCYQTLANALINTGDNKYELSRRFFPDDQAAPIEVRVEYSPVSQSDSQSINKFARNGSIIWYWLAGEFYVFQPLKLFLYRSLFFSPPFWRSQKVTLDIPENCLSVAPADFLTYLTQRLKAYAMTQTVEIEVDESYVGAAVNGDEPKPLSSRTLEGNIGHGIILAVYVVPFFVGLLGLVCLVLLCILNSSCDTTRSKNLRLLLQKFEKKVKQDIRLKSNLVATALICFYFNIFVFIMDMISTAVESNGDLPSYFERKEYLFSVFISGSAIVLFFNVIGLILLINFFFSDNENFLWCTMSKMYRGYVAMTVCCGSAILALSFHFQNILIAWSIVPFYAGKIVLHYGVILFICFLSLKFAAKYSFILLQDKDKSISKAKRVLISGILIVTSVIVVGTIATVAIFIVYIPISNSIEVTAVGITTVYHGAVLFIGALIAYNIGGHYFGGSFSINTVLRRAMIKTDNNPNGSDEDWTLESEEVRMSKIVNRFITKYLKDNAIQEPNAEVQGAAPGVQGAAPGVQGAAPGVQGAAPGVQGAAPGVQGAAPGVQGAAQTSVNDGDVDGNT